MDLSLSGPLSTPARVETSVVGVGSRESTLGPNSTSISGPSFKEALRGAVVGGPTDVTGAAAGSLKFSNHAIDRMRSRGIQFSPEQLGKIESAIDKVKAKGGKETLMLTTNSALIVNIANKTVVTVMDQQNLKENVFTNIDSTIVI